MAVSLAERGPGLRTGVAVAVVAAAATAASWWLAHAPYRLSGVALVAPALVLVSLPLLTRAARREDDPLIARLLLWAFWLKLVFSMARYLVAVEVYGGAADAIGYHNWGTQLAPLLRDGVLLPDVGRDQFLGTGFTRLLTGVIYVVTGPTLLGGFLVFSWLSFWGLYFCYRAFVVAVPDGDHRRYAKLVLFLPSLLFWPSSIGKDAWMMLGLGLCLLGAAHLLNGNLRGWSLLALGLVASTLVRPHIAALFIAAFSAAALARRARRADLMSPIRRLAGLAVLLALVMVVAGAAGSYFGVEEIDAEGVTATVTATADRTSTGGSEFTATTVRSPADVPLALVTVLFRPFPNEVRNTQMAAASLEGLFLLVLLCFAFPRWRRLPRMLRTRPFVTLVVLYMLGFVLAFSSFNNFGLLSRQRVQVYPFLLVLLALPRPPRSVGPPRLELPSRSSIPTMRGVSQ